MLDVRAEFGVKLNRQTETPAEAGGRPEIDEHRRGRGSVAGL
jgi:hypothetical protein